MSAGYLHHVFPKTIEILCEKKIIYLQEQFFKTLREQLLVNTEGDVSRWFPVFLKFQGVRPEILEVAEFEYLRHFALELEDTKLKLDPGQVGLNPSAQFVELHYHQIKLNRSSGLYCFFKKNNSLEEFKLNLSQALVIDLIHEERKFSLDQLALQAATHKMGGSLNLQSWKNIICEMLAMGLLLDLGHLNYENKKDSEDIYQSNIPNQ